jgi:outer membrane protein OmpA-like peptidoglycan-associated protein
LREDWAALLLLDGTTENGWCSPDGEAAPHHFVIELAQTYRLQSLVVDNTRAEEDGYPGISAQGIEVWVSTQGAATGYTQALTFQALPGARKEVQLPAGTSARWLKLVITRNGGREDYTEMMELEAYGTPVGDRPELDVSGIYATNYGLMRLEQRGREVVGCYDFDNGTLRGSTDGRVIRFEWREDGDQHGTAVMVLSPTAGALNGLWWEEGSYRGLWQGPRAEPGQAPSCKAPGGSGLEDSLAKSGRAIVYGIYFDSGSDALKPESAAALEALLAALQGNGELRLRIEGHTDAQASEAHNLDLSRRRAAAVRTWLVGRGIEGARLEAEGYGESRPVAENATPQGRALNRRVEVATL